ncbi:MAG: hypothetical protein ACO29Q_10385 [Crocinitomicaceae bacterium]
MSNKQIYDGYKPIVCEMYPKTNRMALVRNGEFLGYVKVNNDNNNQIRMFDPLDVVINLQISNIFLSINDLMIIQECWNQMQEIRMSEK